MKVPLRLTILRAVIWVLSITIAVILVNEGSRDTKNHQSVPLAFPKGDSVQRVLILGLDKYERPNNQIGYLNDMQSDFILLLAVDAQNQTCAAVHINRDTMTQITRLGVFGDEAERFTGQLALAHTFGSGGSDSNLNTVKAVSHLFGDLTIDHYMTFTMESVGIVNDLVGGVTVKILDDFPAEYGRLRKGETVTLRGKEALAYVRGRKGVGDQTNVRRMERQKQFLEAIYPMLQEKMRIDSSFSRSMLTEMSDSFETDCTVSQLDALFEVLGFAKTVQILTLEGEVRHGEEVMEFYPSQSSIAHCAAALGVV